MYFKMQSPTETEPVWWLLSDGCRGSSAWPSDRAGWSRLIDYVEANGLGSVVARRLTAGEATLPSDLQARLVQLDASTVAASEMANSQARQVAEALHNAEVAHYWLKGVAWGSALYAGKGARPMRDLDLIVHNSSLSKASEALAHLKYETDPLGGPAGQHLPRLRHPSGVKIDLHHRIVPATIYGFRVTEPQVPWGPSEGLVFSQPDPVDALFHLQHMVIHVFHHSFYNLRLMHLYDIKLALDSWNVSPEEVMDNLASVMPPKITRDILALCDVLFDIGGAFTRFAPRWIVTGLIRRGSMPLLYPLMRSARWPSFPDILAAESARGLFVLRQAPGRFGRPAAALHPPM